MEDARYLLMWSICTAIEYINSLFLSGMLLRCSLLCPLLCPFCSYILPPKLSVSGWHVGLSFSLTTCELRSSSINNNRDEYGNGILRWTPINVLLTAFDLRSCRSPSSAKASSCWVSTSFLNSSLSLIVLNLRVTKKQTWTIKKMCCEHIDKYCRITQLTCSGISSLSPCLPSWRW